MGEIYFLKYCFELGFYSEFSSNESYGPGFDSTLSYGWFVSRESFYASFPDAARIHATLTNASFDDESSATGFEPCTRLWIDDPASNDP